MSATRIQAILLAALMLASPVLLLPADDARAQSEGVPVQFEDSAFKRADLHFWRVGEDAANTNSCQGPGIGGQAGSSSAFCNLRIDPIPDDDDEADRESRAVAPSLQDIGSDHIVQFVLDTDSDTNIGEVAQYPFTIKGGGQAVQYSFWYNSDTPCQETFAGTQGQPIGFEMKLLVGSSPEDASPVEDTNTTTIDCSVNTNTLNEDDAHRIDVTITLEEDHQIQAGDTVVAQIGAYDPNEVGDGGQTSPSNWALFFESASRNSKVVLKTDGVVEQAIWASDKNGDLQQSFDPDAPTDERYMVGRAAFRSAFGSDAVPTSSPGSPVFQGEIKNPDGDFVDLDPSTDSRETSVAMEEISGLSKNNGSLKVYKFAPLSGDDTWHYPAGVATGPYEIAVTGTILGKSLNPTETVAMGAFDFELAPVPGESTTHDLLRDSSTTFLMQIENQAPSQDTFDLSADFDFAEPPGSPWNVELSGVDQNNRITLDAAGEPGSRAIVQVKVTPPSEATVGDAARVNLTAVSTASDTMRSVSLQATITDQTVREVGLIALQPGAFTVGVDTTEKIEVFAWNKGTATDSIRVNIVPDSFTNENKLNATLLQKKFDNVEPGAIAPVPIQLETSDEVELNETLGFQIKANSVATPEEESEALTIEATIESERAFDLFALDGRREASGQSTRYGKINQTETDPTSPACESRENTGPEYDENCKDYTTFAYHRLTLENTGDLTETFSVSLPSQAQSFDDPGCDPILPGRVDLDDIGFVTEVNHQNPSDESVSDSLSVDLDAGETQQFFVRVPVNGRVPYYQDLGSFDSACTWEAIDTSVVTNLEGTPKTKVIDTRTKVFVEAHPSSSDFDKSAKARVAALGSAIVNGSLTELPDFTGVEPGEAEALHFTVSQQAGHYDPMNVKIGPQDRVQELRDDGWRIDIVSPAVEVSELDDGFGVRIPDDGSLEANETITRLTGYDVPLRLMVKAPETGVQEDLRERFTITAESTYRGDVEDSIGVGVQVGKDFAFDVDAGTQTAKATPGDTAGFSLLVKNTGASRDTFDVAASISPDTFPTPSVQPDQVTVSSGSEKAVAIGVEVPDNAAGTTATISVQVTGERGTADPDDDIGPVTREYTLEVGQQGTIDIAPVEDPVRVGPGGQNAINFTITNQQNAERDIRLVEQIAPPGWKTTLSDSNATKTVAAEGETTFTYLIEAPDDIVEGSLFTFSLLAEDVDNPDDFATTVAHATTQGETAVRLDAEDSRQVVERGDNTTFAVLVNNPGTSPTWYDLDTEFTSSGWDSEILRQDGDPIPNASIRVAEKQFKRVLVDVSAPENVEQGHVERLTLTARADGQPSIRDSARLEAQIHDFGVSLEITGALTKDAVPGDDVAYSVSITNTGNGEDEISLGYEGADDEDPPWPVSSELQDETTPVLEPGETLENVTVEVHVPGPGEGPVPVPEGVETLIRATSGGELPDGGSPTATGTVTTRLVKYVRHDVDGDDVFEMGVDLNRDSTDGFETFADRDATLISRGELDAGDSRASNGLYTLDGDEDDRIEHIVDVDGDGIGDRYFDPDRASVYTIPYTFDADDDGQPDHPIDANFDGDIDGVYDPADDTVHKAVHLDFSGDGRLDLLIDENDDTFYDTFVDPNESPPIVTDVERDGDLYKIDTDDNGEVDTHYDAQTQSIEDARVGNFQTFLGDYWWFLLVFLVVVGLFGLIVYRRL